MNTFLALLVLAYARSEKLDLTYLPPPGSQYAGERPGDIQVPLEFPKETYSTTLRPQDFDGGVTYPEDYQATIGINRGQPIGTTDAGVVTPGSKAPFSYYQNTNKVPTTTVSYAFTQTTTHPPTEGYETTIGPQFAGIDYPSQDGFNNFQSQDPNLIYQGYDQQQTQFLGQPQSVESQYPSNAIQSQGPVISENQQTQNRPGFQQNINQFGGQGPTSLASGPDSEFTRLTTQPQGTSGIYQEDLQTQNIPGFKPFGNQYIGQNPTNAPISGSSGFLNIPPQNMGTIGQNFDGQRTKYLNQQSPGYSQPITGTRPGVPFGQNQYQNQTSGKNEFVNQPGFFPSSTLAPSVSSTTQPGISYGNIVNNIQGSLPRRPYATQSNLPVEIGTTFSVNDEKVNQKQIPGAQIIGDEAINGNRQNIIRPSSTVRPTTLTPGLQNTEFPTVTSTAPEFYSTSGYPDAPFNSLNGKEPSIYRQRPDRPQAESDKNAVILNYENVITPEGFAYSFDTSNGIHADESGTTTDGVKAKGSYSYIGDDGKMYSIVYTADENGYQPHGDHLPTPPPIPEAIQEIIEKVKKEKKAGIYHDGSYNDDKYGYKNYQGSMRYRPKGPKKHLTNGADISEENVTETIVSSGDLSDFDVANQERYVDSGKNKDDDQKPGRINKNQVSRNNGQVSTQRPVNQLPTNGEEINDQIRDDEDQTQYFELTSPRPFKQPTNQQFNKIQDSKSAVINGINNERRRPSNKMKQTEYQTSTAYDLEEPYENGDGNTRILNKGSGKRPLYKQRPQNNQQDNTLTDTLEYYSSSKPLLTPGSSKRPVTKKTEKINAQPFEEYKSSRPANKLPNRRPTNTMLKVNIPDQYETDEDYTESIDQPSERPNEFSDKKYPNRVTDGYGNNDYVTETPSRPKPGRKQSTTRDQFTRRRPSYKSKNQNTQNEGTAYQPEEDEKYLGSQRFQNVPSQEYENRRVIEKPTKILSGSQYKETEENDENVPEDGFYDPGSTTAAKYDNTRVRPQASRPRAEKPIFVQNNRGEVFIGDNKSPAIPKTKFGQKLVRPSINQQNILVEIEDNQRPSSESGYQYIPPQRKFEQDESKFPIKDTGSVQIPYTRRPQENVFYEKNKIKSKPFLTPNVSRDEMAVSDDEYDQEENPEIVSDTIEKQQENEDSYDSEYSYRSTTPAQILDDKIISSTKFPSKMTYGSTYGPFSTTSRPSRPQYYQNEYSTENNQRNRGPGPQGIDRTNGTKSTKAPLKGASSTTVIPSTETYYGSTYGPTTVEEQNNYITGNTQTPSQGIISSTTPLPSQKPTFSGSYQNNTNKPQDEPTFGTLRPTNEYIDGAPIQGLPGVSPTYSPSSVGPNKNTQYGSNLPSTTYRPNYSILGSNEPSSTAVPGVVVDGFGRPIRPGSTVQDNAPGSISGQPIRDQTTDVRYRSGRPSNEFRGQQRYRPGTNLGQEVTPSPTFQLSTQKIIGEDFSGPKQQQKFDPETGYYY